MYSDDPNKSKCIFNRVDLLPVELPKNQHYCGNVVTHS